MSFLLTSCRELNYNELLVVNGGCSSAPVQQSPGFIKTIYNMIQDKKSGSSGTTGTTTTTTSTGTSIVTSSSSYCSGSRTSSSGGCSGSVVKSTSSTSQAATSGVKTTLCGTGTCAGSAVKTYYKQETGVQIENGDHYYIQKLLGSEDLSTYEKFNDSACGATSLLNEVIEQYKIETGQTVTEAQAKEALKAAIAQEGLREKDAFVKNWTTAAQAMGDALGMEGTWKYVENADNATAIIISIDTKNDEKKYDGYHDHFVNYIGNGQYYDPYTNKIGHVSDLHLTTNWYPDDGIKSCYRYLSYTPKK
ncbi:MAG: hypothetical protein MJ188_03710 [Treponema sp.]|nr:hypothetical protein [Treponema sp.]